jgi:hypothetical protein
MNSVSAILAPVFPSHLIGRVASMPLYSNDPRFSALDPPLDWG